VIPGTFARGCERVIDKAGAASRETSGQAPRYELEPTMVAPTASGKGTGLARSAEGGLRRGGGVDAPPARSSWGHTGRASMDWARESRSVYGPQSQIQREFTKPFPSVGKKPVVAGEGGFALRRDSARLLDSFVRVLKYSQRTPQKLWWKGAELKAKGRRAAAESADHGGNETGVRKLPCPVAPPLEPPLGHPFE